jgi:hypothetical protein
MRLIAPDGAVFGGVDAILEIARHIWWAEPLCRLSHFGWVMRSLRLLYRWFAHNRKCFGGACATRRRGKVLLPRVAIWATAAAPTLAVLCLGKVLIPWVWMWAIAVSMFAGSKVLTVFGLVRSGCAAPRRRLLAYALLWPGMDAHAFCGNTAVPKPAFREWFDALARIVVGTAVTWFGARNALPAHPLLAGWLGMLGVVLVLHFGFLHLISIIWRRAGIDAEPLMKAPFAATSLSRLWGERWNTAFSVLIHDNVFKPAAALVGPRAALISVFLVSGLLHDVVISVPARGGYGLPTLYFLLQGAALLFERNRTAKRLGLSAGFRGWCFVALMAGVPVFLLFHPVFIRTVILPMLRCIGAT